MLFPLMGAAQVSFASALTAAKFNWDTIDPHPVRCSLDWAPARPGRAAITAAIAAAVEIVRFPNICVPPLFLVTLGSYLHRQRDNGFIQNFGRGALKQVFPAGIVASAASRLGSLRP